MQSKGEENGTDAIVQVLRGDQRSQSYPSRVKSGSSCVVSVLFSSSKIQHYCYLSHCTDHCISPVGELVLDLQKVRAWLVNCWLSSRFRQGKQDIKEKIFR